MHLWIVTWSYLKFIIARNLLWRDSANISQPLLSFPKYLDLSRAEIGTYLDIVGQLLFPRMKYLQWDCFGLRRAEMRTEFGCKFQMHEWAVKLAMTSTPFWKCHSGFWSECFLQASDLRVQWKAQQPYSHRGRRNQRTFPGSYALILKLLTWCSGFTFFFHNKSPKIEQTLKAWHLLQLSNPSWPEAEVGEVSTKSKDSAKTFFVCFSSPKCSAQRQGSWLLLSCFQSSYIITARLQR